jgi:Transmembrane amino acid transporter protein
MDFAHFLLPRGAAAPESMAQGAEYADMESLEGGAPSGKDGDAAGAAGAVATGNARQGTVLGTILNFVTNTVGAGMLSLPWCIANCSLVPGIVALCIAALLNSCSVLLLAASAQLAQAYTYRELGEAVGGPWLGYFAQVASALYVRFWRIGVRVWCDFVGVSMLCGLGGWCVSVRSIRGFHKRPLGSRRF